MHLNTQKVAIAARRRGERLPQSYCFGELKHKLFRLNIQFITTGNCPSSSDTPRIIQISTRATPLTASKIIAMLLWLLHIQFKLQIVYFCQCSRHTVVMARVTSSAVGRSSRRFSNCDLSTVGTLLKLAMLRPLHSPPPPPPPPVFSISVDSPNAE